MIRTHKWHILQCSAITGKNLKEGLSWVIEEAKARLFLFWAQTQVTICIQLRRVVVFNNSVARPFKQALERKNSGSEKTRLNDIMLSLRLKHRYQCRRPCVLPRRPQIGLSLTAKSHLKLYQLLDSTKPITMSILRYLPFHPSGLLDPDHVYG